MLNNSVHLQVQGQMSDTMRNELATKGQAQLTANAIIRHDIKTVTT
jgi:hypothetical protein